MPEPVQPRGAPSREPLGARGGAQSGRLPALFFPHPTSAPPPGSNDPLRGVGRPGTRLSVQLQCHGIEVIHIASAEMLVVARSADPRRDGDVAGLPTSALPPPPTTLPCCPSPNPFTTLLPLLFPMGWPFWAATMRAVPAAGCIPGTRGIIPLFRFLPSLIRTSHLVAEGPKHEVVHLPREDPKHNAHVDGVRQNIAKVLAKVL